MASKSVDSNTDLPAKWRHTTNPRFLDDDNISPDAIKRRKLEASKSSNLESILSAKSSKISSEISRKSSCQASVESIADDSDYSRNNAGPPKNPRLILESSEEEDNNDTHPPAKKTQMPKPKPTNLVQRESMVDLNEGEKLKDESDNEELGKS
jgi:hypothetical protein